MTGLCEQQDVQMAGTLNRKLTDKCCSKLMT